jgi:hypothetical protein
MNCRKLPDCRQRIFFAIACLAILFAVGCNKPDAAAPQLAIASEIAPQPVRVGAVTVAFSVTEQGKPVSGARISVEANMSHAGMSPVFAEAKEAQPGSYRSQLTFPMAGDWVLLLHGTLADGKKFERQIHVNDVRPN